MIAAGGVRRGAPGASRARLVIALLCAATGAVGTASCGRVEPANGGEDAGGSDAATIDAAPVAVDAGCTCTPAAPSGWTGPFELYAGDPANAPSCPSGAAKVLAAFAGLEDAGPAACPSCSCGALDGGSCDPAAYTGQLNWFAPGGSTPCSLPAGCQSSPLIGGSACTVYEVCSGSGYVQVGVSVPLIGGGCPASTTGETTMPPIAWQTAHVGCALQVSQSRACGAGSVCVAAPEPPFASPLCILHRGDVDCPGTPYASKATVYEAAEDTRGCTACACTPPASCDTSGSLGYTNDPIPECGANGGGPVVPFEAGTCMPLAAQQSGFMLEGVTGTPPPTGCTPSGGAPTGTVTPSQPVTVCCTP